MLVKSWCFISTTIKLMYDNSFVVSCRPLLDCLHFDKPVQLVTQRAVWGFQWVWALGIELKTFMLTWAVTFAAQAVGFWGWIVLGCLDPVILAWKCSYTLCCAAGMKRLPLCVRSTQLWCVPWFSPWITSAASQQLQQRHHMRLGSSRPMVMPSSLPWSDLKILPTPPTLPAAGSPSNRCGGLYAQ